MSVCIAVASAWGVVRLLALCRAHGLNTSVTPGLPTRSTWMNVVCCPLLLEPPSVGSLLQLENAASESANDAPTTASRLICFRII